MNFLEALKLVYESPDGRLWARPAGSNQVTGYCFSEGHFLEVPSVHGGEPAMLPDPSELFGEWEILDIVEKRVQVNMGDQKVLTDKGTAAVEEMDNRYKELCQEFGTDPDDWRPDVWIKANEDFLLDWNLRAARQRFSTSSAS